MDLFFKLAGNEIDRPSVNFSALKRQTPARGGGLKALIKTSYYWILNGLVFNYLVFNPLPTFGSFSILRVM